MRAVLSLATLGLAACVPTDEAAQHAANAGPCARTEIIHGWTAMEMPPQDFGGDLVGLFTLITGEARYNGGRFSLIDCRTARITRVEGGDSDIRAWIEAMRRAGSTGSVDRLARDARAAGLSVEEGAVPRKEGTRAGCACGSIHPETWYEGFPPDATGYKAPYVGVTLLPAEGTLTTN